MAAGGVDVLRRRDSRFPGNEYFHGESGSRVCNGVDRYDDSGSRKNRFSGRSEERKEERASSSREDKASNLEGRYLVELSRDKKRKYSPILGDKEDKGVRVSSKKRVAANTPPSHRVRVPSQVLDSELDSNTSKSGVLKLDTRVEAVELSTFEDALVVESLEPASSKNLVDLSQGFLTHQDQDVQQMQDEMEGEEVGLGRSISMSRWASQEDSPLDISDGECTPYTVRSLSTESGELQREGSSGNRARFSGSDDEGFYVRSGSGDKCSGDELSDGDAGSNQIDCDSDGHGDDSQINERTVCNRRHVNMFQSCRSVFEYEKLNKINEGTYGVVYKARDKKTGEIVALKKVKMDVTNDDYGFPLSSLREINILSSFSHPSIVDVKEVAMDDADGVYMVMEHMESDLKGLMEKMKDPFSISEVKLLMLQLLEGVKYLHDNWVLHRDLKTSNLLLNKDGTLKICDFGMSRQYGSPLKPYTALVVTLWYRAPEILLGTKEYSTAIDMWSVGCIMAELIAKCPLFRGKTEVEQLDKIFRTLGTPNETIWPGLSNLPGSKAKFVKQPYNMLRKKFPAASFIGAPVLSDLGFDLLSRLLTYNPEKRITAEEALNHKWFVEAPLPKSDFQPSLSAVQSQSRYISRGQ